MWQTEVGEEWGIMKEIAGGKWEDDKTEKK